MPTRRSALKTLAGATVVGSLSGCVQLATQSTVEYHGTPAMATTVVGGDYLDGATVATGVGVEIRRTIERLGVEKEIVTHNWGMLYRIFKGDLDEYNTVSGFSVPATYQGIVTFTTPSIQIAGQELNPIAELSVGDIGDEFASIVFPFSQDGQVGDLEAGSFATKTVEDATGRKVLRAFRDSVASSRVGEDEEVDSIVLNTKFQHIANATAPSWDGDTYEGVIEYQEGGVSDLAIRFDKHDDDFVVTVQLPTGKTIDSQQIVHPSDDEFTQEMLRHHLIETNLQGAQGMLEQSRKLINETQDLLTEVKNDTRNEEDARFTAITATQDDLKQFETILGGLGEDFASLSVDVLIGGTGKDTIRRVQERSEKAAEIATRAHERIASYNNDTRNEEDARFLQMEQNLGGIEALAKNLPGFTGQWVMK